MTEKLMQDTKTENRQQLTALPPNVGSVASHPYYQDDRITIYHGDCLEILKSIAPVEVIITDPPYGVNLEYDTYDDTLDNWFELMDKFIPIAIKNAKMTIMPCCRIKALPWIYQNHPPDWMICWYKGSTGCSAYIGFNDWEPLLVYGKNDHVQMHDYFNVSNTEKMGNYGHPCPKPIKWAKWLIDRTSQSGGTIIDPFMGSGTTLLAAKSLGRKAIGIEQSEAYCKIAVQRLAQCELF